MQGVGYRIVTPLLPACELSDTSGGSVRHGAFEFRTRLVNARAGTVTRSLDEVEARARIGCFEMEGPVIDQEQTGTDCRAAGG